MDLEARGSVAGSGGGGGFQINVTWMIVEIVEKHP